MVKQKRDRNAQLEGKQFLKAGSCAGRNVYPGIKWIFYCMYFIFIHMLDLITDKQTRRVHYLYGVINIYMRTLLQVLYTSALRGGNQNKLRWITFCHCIKMPENEHLKHWLVC